MTRSFYVKYLRQTLKSIQKDESRYRELDDPDFVKQAAHLASIAEATQNELDRVMSGPEEGDFSAALAEFNKNVLLPVD